MTFGHSSDSSGAVAAGEGGELGEVEVNRCAAEAGSALVLLSGRTGPPTKGREICSAMGPVLHDNTLASPLYDGPLPQLAYQSGLPATPFQPPTAKKGKKCTHEH